MGFLNGWITNIILFILLAIIIDLLLPNSSMQKYVKLVVGLLLIVIVITPLFQIFSTDIDDVLQSINLKSGIQEKNIENSIEMKKKEIQASQRAYILEQMAVQMKSDVNEELVQKYGLTVQHISLTIPNEKVNENISSAKDISSIEVVLSKKDKKDVAVSAVKTITIDTSKPIQKKSENHVDKAVVNYLASKWEIDPKKLTVVTDGGSG